MTERKHTPPSAPKAAHRMAAERRRPTWLLPNAIAVAALSLAAAALALASCATAPRVEDVDARSEFDSPGDTGFADDDTLSTAIVIGGGVYVRGASALAAGSQPRETAPRPVAVTNAFEVSRTEVTQGEWTNILGANPSFFTSCGSDCPVDQVSYFDAAAYCNARSIAEGLPPCYNLEGCEGDPSSGCALGVMQCVGEFTCPDVPFAELGCSGYRLPSEAEWEFVARPWDAPLNAEPGGAWTQENSRFEGQPADVCDGQRIGTCSTQPTGQWAPNSLGIYDAQGNVWEWTSHPWPSDEAGTNLLVNPAGSSLDGNLAQRGGSYFEPNPDGRVAQRLLVSPQTRNRNAGLRVVRTTGDSDVPVCDSGVPMPTHECWQSFGSSQFDRCPPDSSRISELTVREAAWVTAHWGAAWVDARPRGEGWIWPNGEPVVPPPLGIGDCLRTSADGRFRASDCDDLGETVCVVSRW